jgi:hypothetical protein
MNGTAKTDADVEGHHPASCGSPADAYTPNESHSYRLYQDARSLFGCPSNTNTRCTTRIPMLRPALVVSALLMVHAYPLAPIRRTGMKFQFQLRWSLTTCEYVRLTGRKAIRMKHAPLFLLLTVFAVSPETDRAQLPRSGHVSLELGTVIVGSVCQKRKRSKRYLRMVT